MNVEQLNSRPARWYTLAGLVLVPLLVAGGFLFAGVNAGDRLHTVKAAVVNLDEPVTIDGQYTPLGRQLTANLVDSQRTENLTWVLDSEGVWTRNDAPVHLQERLIERQRRRR